MEYISQIMFKINKKWFNICIFVVYFSFPPQSAFPMECSMCGGGAPCGPEGFCVFCGVRLELSQRTWRGVFARLCGGGTGLDRDNKWGRLYSVPASSSIHRALRVRGAHKAHRAHKSPKFSEAPNAPDPLGAIVFPEAPGVEPSSVVSQSISWNQRLMHPHRQIFFIYSI